MPNQQAATIAAVLVKEWISIFGTPRTIHSHQGSAFESDPFQELCKLLQIEKTRTTTYHPKAICNVNVSTVHYWIWFMLTRAKIPFTGTRICTISRYFISRLNTQLRISNQTASCSVATLNYPVTSWSRLITWFNPVHRSNTYVIWSVSCVQLTLLHVRI